MRSLLHSIAPLLSGKHRSPAALVALLCATGTAYTQDLFHHLFTYGYAGAVEHELRLTDGSYILYGGGGYPSAGSVSRVSATGTMLWNYRVEFPDHECNGADLTSGLVDDEGMLVFAVNGVYPGNGGLLRMSPDGDVIWSLLIGRPINKVIVLQDGNYGVIGGVSLAADQEPWDLHVHEIDREGHQVWGRGYPCLNVPFNFVNADKIAHDLVQLPNGDLCGAFTVNGRLFLMRTNAIGEDYAMRQLYADAGEGNYAFFSHGWRLFPESDGTLRLLGRPKPSAGEGYLVSAHLDADLGALDAVRLDHPNGVAIADAYRTADSTFHVLADLYLGSIVTNHALLHLDGHGHLNGAWGLGTLPDKVGFGVDGDTIDVFSAPPALSDSVYPREMERMTAPFTLECTPITAETFTEAALSVTADGPYQSTIDLAEPEGGELVLTARTPGTSLACTSTIGIMEEQRPTLTVFPNPASGTVYLQGMRVDRIASIRLFDAAGRAVPVIAAQGIIDLAPLPAGPYTCVMLERNGRMQVARIVRE